LLFVDGLNDVVDHLVAQYLVDPEVSPNTVIPIPPPPPQPTLMIASPIHNFVDVAIITRNTRE
jgi:hypothetical protein